MNAIRCMLVCCLVTVFAAGCGSSGNAPSSIRANTLDYTVVSTNGAAALDFGPWTLVLEGVPLPIQYTGSKGTINVPFPNAGGNSTSSIGPVTIAQTWDSQQNAIVLNGIAFKLTERGNKLDFADKSYQTTGARKTIVIGKDGKTREGTN